MSGGRSSHASVAVEGDRIAGLLEGGCGTAGFDTVVDAEGCLVLPGVIDTHVHFREPGLTQKADMASESRAAAYGGVTTFIDMPNTNPQTTTAERLAEKLALGAASSSVNYAFFIGATAGNSGTYASLDRSRLPGVKLFMGASTGNMLVSRMEDLEKVFAAAAAAGLPIVAHCEDTSMVNANMAAAKEKWGEDPPVAEHERIRSAEACFRSTEAAIALALKHGARLHVAHLSTACEMGLFGKDPGITAEAAVPHLLYCSGDYGRLGAKIKCNPSVKGKDDREALRAALRDGTISTIATDHAPHLPADKEGGAAKAASGIPMVQYSLPAMLGLVDAGVLGIERLVELMCHAPAKLFGIRDRGYIAVGYKADIAIVRPTDGWMVDKAGIQSKCGWSPLEGEKLRWRVETTLCNGHLLLHGGVFDSSYRGEEARFG